MRFNSKYIFPFIISFLAFFLLCHFRSLPVSQFWKDYRILYVYSEELSENDILAVLEKNGCDSVISSSNQKIPVLSQLSPVQVQDADSYIYRRSEFFMDKNHRAMVFYVPDTKSAMLDRAVRELSAFQGTNAGTDGKASFPWIAPIISALVFVLFLFFSKNRVLYLLGCSFFILLSFTRPLFTVCAAAMLFYFAFFLFHSLWSRMYFLKKTLNSPYVLLFALSPVLVLLFSSPLHSVFYVIALSGSVSLVWMYFLVQQHRENQYSFKPLFIRSARMMPVMGHLGIRLLGVLLASLFATLLCFKVSENVGSISSSAAMPSLPAPVARGGELVQLSDFINWSWNTVTFPYRKIGEEQHPLPEEGEVVSIKDYQESDGVIKEVETQAFVFNSDFRDSVYKLVEKLDYPAVEKLMLRQGKNASFAYTKKASVSAAERFALILLVVFITVTASLGINYIVGRKRYGLSI